MHPSRLYILLSLMSAVHVISATSSVNIGFLFPFSGSLATGGVQRARAADLALKNINSNSTMMVCEGQKIELVSYRKDTQTNPSVGATVAFELVQDHNIVGLIGAASSGVSMSVALIGNLFKIPQISYSSTSPQLSNEAFYPYFARVAPPDSGQAAAVVALVKTFHWDTIGLISANTAYGTGLLENFESIATTQGISVSSRIVHNPYTVQQHGTEQGKQNLYTNIDSQLDSLAATGVRVFLMNNNVDDAKAVLYRAALKNLVGVHKDETGRDAVYQWIATDGWCNPQLLTASPVCDSNCVAVLRNSVAGIVGTRPAQIQSPFYMNWLEKVWNPNVTTSELNAWLPGWSGISGSNNSWANRGINVYAPFAYDSVWALAHALDAACNDNSNGGTIEERLHNGGLVFTKLLQVEFEGTTGKVEFASNGDRPGLYEFINEPPNGDAFFSLSFGTWLERGSVTTLNKEMVSDVYWASGTRGIENAPPSRLILECSALQAPEGGGMDCSGDGVSAGTVCTFWCGSTPQNIEGMNIVDSTSRRCTDAEEWTGQSVVCLSPEKLPYGSAPIGFLVYGVIVLLFALCLLGFLYVHRKGAVVRLSSPLFQYLILTGCFFVCISAILFAAVSNGGDTTPPKQWTCSAPLWFGHGGALLSFGCLLAKTYRIHRLFNNKMLVRISITNKKVLGYALSILFPGLFILLLWAIIDPLQIKENIVVENGMNYIHHTCESKSKNAFLLTLLCYEAVVLITSMMLSFTVRNANAMFHEAKSIATAVFCVSFLSIITTALVFGINLGPLGSFVLTELSLLSGLVVLMGCIFGPKLYLTAKFGTDGMKLSGMGVGMTNVPVSTTISKSVNLGTINEIEAHLTEVNQEITRVTASLTESESRVVELKERLATLLSAKAIMEVKAERKVGNATKYQVMPMTTVQE